MDIIAFSWSRNLVRDDKPQRGVNFLSGTFAQELGIDQRLQVFIPFSRVIVQINSRWWNVTWIYLSACNARKKVPIMSSKCDNYEILHTHTFLTAVAIVFHSLLLPLSWYQVCHSLLCFLGGVFFWGVLLHDVYLVMERWEGGNFGQMTMIHVCKQKQIQYCSLWMR